MFKINKLPILAICSFLWAIGAQAAETTAIPAIEKDIPAHLAHNNDAKKCWKTYLAFLHGERTIQDTVDDEPINTLRRLFSTEKPNCSSWLFSKKEGKPEEVGEINKVSAETLETFKLFLKERAKKGDEEAQVYYIQACFDGRHGFEYTDAEEQEEARNYAIQWREANLAFQDLLDRAIMSPPNGRLGIWPKDVANMLQFLTPIDKIIALGDHGDEDAKVKVFKRLFDQRRVYHRLEERWKFKYRVSC